MRRSDAYTVADANNCAVWHWLKHDRANEFANVCARVLRRGDISPDAYSELHEDAWSDPHADRNARRSSLHAGSVDDCYVNAHGYADTNGFTVSYADANTQPITHTQPIAYTD